MLRQLLLLPLVTVSSSVSAAIFMSDFTVDNGGFDSSIPNATLMEMDGELAFIPSSQTQGADIEIDPTEVLGSGITNSNVEALFFDFSFRAPNLAGNNDELTITFGNESQSGFTFFFEGDELFVVNGNQNMLLLSDLVVGQAVNFQVEFQTIANGESLTFDGTTVNGGQNGNEINTAAIVSASTADATSDTLLVAGSTNLNASQIDAFTFEGVATRTNSGKITSFTVSDEPIPTIVPEPSSVALLFLGVSSFLLRRKRA